MANNTNAEAGTKSQKFATAKADDIFIYYDRLPVRLRRAMQEANHCYSPKSVYKLYRNVGLDEAINAIQQNDQKIAAEYYETIGGRGVKPPSLRRWRWAASRSASSSS